MADKSAIEWTDATWNPIRARNIKTGKLGWHCEHATTGCEFCYSEDLNKWIGTGLPFKPGHRKDVELFLDETMLTLPLRWKRPRMIFVCSMTDLFADFVPDEFIDKMFAVMALAPQHTFQVLTKRAARIRDYFAGAPKRRIVKGSRGGNPNVSVSTPKSYHSTTKLGGEFAWPLPNVWLGVSTERQQEAEERIPQLLQTPAKVRFISAEPLLGPIDLIGIFARFQDDPIAKRQCAVPLGRQLIDWVIVGGESGAHARPMHPQWARDLRDQCQAAGVAFFFKQWGSWQPRYYLSPPDAAGHSEQLLDLKQTASAIILHANEPKQFPVNMIRMPKKEAGRELDGELHNGFPTRGSDHGV